MTPWRARRSDRGAGTVLIVMVIVVITFVSSIAFWVASWFDIARRAQSLADLAAVAAAQAVLQGTDGCVAADQVVLRNADTQQTEPHLIGCRVDGDPTAFVVRVRVSMNLQPRLSGLPTTVFADAVAGPATGA